jgi:hypothetical protein
MPSSSGLQPFRSGARKAFPTEHEEIVSQQIPEGLSADARPRNNHPFVLNPDMPGERLFVPQCL